MRRIHIKVQLSENRNQSGLMTVVGRKGPPAIFQVLARGSRGAGDTQMMIKGNTPTGRYRISEIVDTSQWNTNSYGSGGALRLDPISGNALAAERQAGRSGLLIHGGSLGGSNYWRGANELRATHGCLRLSNQNISELMDLIWHESANEEQLMSEPVEIDVTISDHPMSFRRP